MTIKINNSNVSNIYFGNKQVKSIYVGNTCLYKTFGDNITLHCWSIDGAFINPPYIPTQYIYTVDTTLTNTTVFYDKNGIAFSQSTNEGGCAIWENNALTITKFTSEAYNVVQSGITLTRMENEDIIITEKSIQLYLWKDPKGYFSETGLLLPINAYETNFSSVAYIPANTMGGTTIRPSFCQTQDVWGLMLYISGDNGINDAYNGLIVERNDIGDDPLYTYNWR